VSRWRRFAPLVSVGPSVCEATLAPGADVRQPSCAKPWRDSPSGTAPAVEVGPSRVYFPLLVGSPTLSPWAFRRDVEDGSRVAPSGASRKVLLSRNNCPRPVIIADFAWYYHHAMAPLGDRWAERARVATRERDNSKAHYAKARARALRWNPDDRVATCGRRFAVIRCGCRHVRVPIGCGLRGYCPRCARTVAKARKKRLVKAMVAHQTGATRAWEAAGKRPGGHPRWGLLTLTVRHSGDPATDRRRILAGFTSLRKWLHRHFHRAPPYALLWEITPGEDGRGHVHAHVALQIPALSKPKFSEFRNVWLSAVPESRQFNYQLAKKGPVGAARYLAKYLSKTVSVAEFGPELAALAVASQYGQRVVSASQRFWIASTAPKCRTCHQLWELVDKPQPLVRMNALLVAQLDAGVTGYPRGPTQVAWPFALAVEGDDGDVARGRGLRCGLG